MAIGGLPVTPVDRQGNVIASDFYAAVAMGQVSGVTTWNVLGHNPDVDDGVALPEDIWEGGGVYPWMTGATSLEIVSSSALDTAAGTGARTFGVLALDTNYDPIQFTVTMNGITPVVFPQSIFRIQRIIITSAGTGGTNAGVVTIRNAGGGTTRGIIPIGIGVTRSSAYTVPRGKTLFITTYTMSMNRPTTARDCTIAGLIRAPQGYFIVTNEISIDGNPFERQHVVPIRIPEMHDTVFRCLYVSAANSDITASWAGIVRDN